MRLGSSPSFRHSPQPRCNPGCSMRLKFHTLDVFTTTRFGGNPLAVVLDADGLDTAAMQSIAREFNLSETVFVLKAAKTLGILARFAHLHAESRGAVRRPPDRRNPPCCSPISRRKGSEPSRTSLIALEEEIGIVRVGVRVRENEPAVRRIRRTAATCRRGRRPPQSRIPRCPRSASMPNEVGFENHRPSRFSVGLAFHFVPVRSLEAIGRAPARWQAAGSAPSGGDGARLYLLPRDGAHYGSQFHARMFAPSLGVSEDPATGSATAAFAAVIARYDEPPPGGEHRYTVEQGFEMGRPSLLHLFARHECTVASAGRAHRWTCGAGGGWRDRSPTGLTDRVNRG